MAATLTDEARELCEKYIGRLLDEWEVPVQVRIGLTGGGGVKLPDVTVVRERLVRRLRDTCWQDHRGRPKGFLVNHADPGIPWVRLSTPNIGLLLGLTHTAVVKSLQRTAKLVDTAVT